MVLFIGCGEEEAVSANDLKAQVAVSAVADYCAEPESDEAWQAKQDGVRDLLDLLREDPDAAREKATDAAGMLDDCGERDDAQRLDRAVARAD